MTPPLADAPGIRSPLADLRAVRLSEMPNLSASTLDGALQRVLPDSPMAPVPVAAFNSAI